jgi:hypothetical protein
LYQWSSAHYTDPPDPTDAAWVSALKKHSHQWLLSADPAPGGAAAPERSALWYDFGDEELISAFVNRIRSLLEANRYQGVFLDTLGSYSLPEPMLRSFEQRHPGDDYNRCQSAFLSKLKIALGPQAIVFTNQGYRRPQDFLPNSDFDLIENSCTYIKQDGSTGFRPWFDGSAPWESIAVPMNNLVVAAAKLFPRTRFVHINYATGDKSTCDRAVSYSFACAKLWNHLSFVTSPDIQKPCLNDLYFQSLGRPVTSAYEQDRDAGVAWRRYENGVVALNSSTKPYRIPSLNLALSDPPRGYVFTGTHKSQ